MRAGGGQRKPGGEDVDATLSKVVTLVLILGVAGLAAVVLRQRAHRLEDKSPADEFLEEIRSAADQHDEAGVRRLVTGNEEMAEATFHALLRESLISHELDRPQSTQQLALAGEIARAYEELHPGSGLPEKVSLYQSWPPEMRAKKLKADALLQAARLEADRKDPAARMLKLKEVVALYEEILDMSAAGGAHSELGNTYLAMAQYAEALHHLRRAADLNQRLNPGLAGSDFNNVGVIENMMSRPHRALAAYERSLAFSRQFEMHENYGITVSNMGHVYRSLYDHDRAVERFRAAREIATKHGLTRVLADAEIGEGLVLARQGYYSDALEALQKGWQLAREAKIKREMADAGEALGMVHLQLGDAEKALEYLVPARALYAEINEPFQAAQTFLHIGNAHRDRKQPEEALAAYRAGLEMAERLKVAPLSTQVLSLIGSTYVMQGQAGQAIEYFEQASRARSSTDRHGLASDQIGIARARIDQNDPRGALEALRKAQGIGEAFDDPEILWSIHGGLGYVHAVDGNLTEAAAYYAKAADAIDKIRVKQRREEHRQAFFADKETVYANALLVALQRDRVGEAFEYAERAKSRTLVDLLESRRIAGRDAVEDRLIDEERTLSHHVLEARERILERKASGPVAEKTLRSVKEQDQELRRLQTQYPNLMERIRTKDPELAALMFGDFMPLGELQSMLEDGVVLLEYFVTDQHTICIAISRATIHVGHHPIGIEELQEKIRRLRAAIEARRDDYQKEARELYDILIHPVEQFLGQKRLVIAPHRALHHLPFAALLREDGRHLIEAHSLVVVPNATTLRYVVQKRRPTLRRFVGFADSLGDLSLAREESEEIARAFPESRIWVGGEVTKEAVRRSVAGADVVHFACHGVFEEQFPLLSHLRLAGEGNEGKLFAYEVFGLDLQHAQLVVLGACQSGLVSVGRGDELVGLLRGFMYAGAPSVVATLWEVAESSTSFLLRRFYARLSTLGGPEALREAQQSVAAEPQFRHPYFWSGVFLAGDWR